MKLWAESTGFTFHKSHKVSIIGSKPCLWTLCMCIVNVKLDFYIQMLISFLNFGSVLACKKDEFLHDNSGQFRSSLACIFFSSCFLMHRVSNFDLDAHKQRCQVSQYSWHVSDFMNSSKGVLRECFFLYFSHCLFIASSKPKLWLPDTKLNSPSTIQKRVKKLCLDTFFWPNFRL